MFSVDRESDSDELGKSDLMDSDVSDANVMLPSVSVIFWPSGR
jgi:hypothetical protein